MGKQRKTETKNYIKIAFTELLREKGMEGITVMDIARKAGINRGTFYTHYVDKFDLMEKLEGETIYELKQILLQTDKVDLNDPIELIPYPLILGALNYVKKDFSFISALAGEGGDPQFISMLKDILSELITSKVALSTELQFKNRGLQEDYAREIAELITKAKQISPYELWM
ncbi:MAG: TetR/AcrR family transcriptional regulator [Enterococcus viikkiensis]